MTLWLNYYLAFSYDVLRGLISEFPNNESWRTIELEVIN